MQEILKVFDWIEIASKNKYMKSFIKENKRLNYYYTTGTVTIQSSDDVIGPSKVYKNINTPLQMEKIIS